MMKNKQSFLRLLSSTFLVLSVLFLGIFLILLPGKNLSPPDNFDAESIKTNLMSDRNADDKTYQDIAFYETEDKSTSYLQEIENYLNTPQIDPYQMQDMLWEFSEYNKSLKDNSEPSYITNQIDNSFYIAKTYIKFEGKIKDSLELALKEIEYSEKLLSEYTGDKTKYKLASLGMLSTIYQMLGIKCENEREFYYIKAADYIKELMPIMDKKSKNEYVSCVIDLANIEDELGNYDESLNILKEALINMNLRINESSVLSDFIHDSYVKEGGINYKTQSITRYQKDLIFKYILLLLKRDGNENEISDLYKKIENNTYAKEDYRYEEIIGMCRKYMGIEVDGGSNSANGDV